MFNRKPPPLPVDTVISRLISLGIEYGQVAGYVWRAKNGEEPTEADQALNILVMRIVDEEFAERWTHGLLAAPVEDVLAVAYPTS